MNYKLFETIKVIILILLSVGMISLFILVSVNRSEVRVNKALIQANDKLDQKELDALARIENEVHKLVGGR